MHKLFNIILKEILLLVRDKMGLMTLFLLPLCLVLVMSFIQKDIGSNQSIKVLLVNQNKTVLSKQLVKQLKHNDYFTIKQQNNLEKAKQSVAKGQARALIVLTKSNQSSKMRVQLYLDPAMPSEMRSSLELAMKYFLQTVTLKAQGKVATLFQLNTQSIITQAKVEAMPNVVQQNIPAWTLFGMFFIVVPFASLMIREKNDGVEKRLFLLPVSYGLQLTGRMITYLTVNLIQLAMMIVIGIYLFPLLGLPALDISTHIYLIALVGIFASLTAIGVGALLGSLLNTQHQVSTVGPFIIVITAAISGIFIPTYLMPKALVFISEYSPLYWAQSSFLDILVRQADFMMLLPNLIKLLLFFSIMLLLAIYIKPRKRMQ